MANSIAITGRLTKDTEVTMSNNGKKIAKNSIADYRSANKTNFYNIVAFEKSAEMLANYTSKGSMVTLYGELDLDKYTNRDGVNVERPSIIVNRVCFMEKKNDNQQAPVANNPFENDGFSIDRDALPF